MNPKILAKKTAGFLWEVYGPFFPVLKKKREKFLDKVRDKVEFYQPMIEEKTGVELGKIRVKDNREWLSDITYGKTNLMVLERAWKNGKIPDELDYSLGYMGAALAEALFLPPTWIYNNLIGAELRHKKNTIYVPFNYLNRFMDVDFKKREESLDYCVVHELAHSLWGRLEEKGLFEEEHSDKFGDWRRWHEGFATYCADEYFKEFYPEGTNTAFPLKKVYLEGKRKVEEAIMVNGEEILLKIPKEWEELQIQENKRRYFH